MVARASAFVIFVIAAGGPAPKTASAETEPAAKGPPAPTIVGVERADGTPGIVMRMYLETTVERVWAVVADPDSGPKLFDTVTAIRRSHEHAGLWEYHLKSPLGSMCVYCHVTKDRQAGTVSWRRQTGALATFEGYFRIRESKAHPGYVKVEYGSYIEPGGLGSLLMTESKRRKMVEKMIPRLKKLTEG
jgi:uncharacterized membrane protein